MEQKPSLISNINLRNLFIFVTFKYTYLLGFLHLGNVLRNQLFPSQSSLEYANHIGLHMLMISEG